MKPNAITSPYWLLNRPIAHRGLHGSGAPENSLAAFDRAVAGGYPVELDVRLLADGNVAVFHDKDAGRLTGVEGPIEAFTAETLKHLRLLSGPDQIPLLPDVLDLIAGRVGILIELKNESTFAGPLETAVLQALEGYGGDYAVQSFNHTTVAFFADRSPDILRGQLASASTEALMPDDLRSLLRRNFTSHADFAAYNLDSIPSKTTERLRDMNVPVIAWTIKTPDEQVRAQTVADNYIFEGLLP